MSHARCFFVWHVLAYAHVVGRCLQVYVTVYERSRALEFLAGETESIRNGFAAVAATVLQQALQCPIDTVQQRAMVSTVAGTDSIQLLLYFDAIFLQSCASFLPC